jgi:hypothetical protein
MTLHKSQMRRHARDHKQERKFFLALGAVTLLLILVLYLLNR